MAKIHPFAKWCGGKGRWTDQIIKRLPDKIETYFEPFVGGGAVFLRLAQDKKFKHAIIGDSNDELIGVWRIIQSNVSGLVKMLQSGEYKYNKDVYLKIRAIDPATLSPVERAARFIYLNHAGFNGLFRVNKSGKFNVPFGRYTNPTILDENNLRALSSLLKKISIMCSDFEQICSGWQNESPGLGDAIYFDPPYIPVSKTSKFTSYTIGGFTQKDHERLAECFKVHGNQGVRVVLSNSVAPLALKLYDEFDMDIHLGSRSIGGPASYREPAKEILVFHGPKSASSKIRTVML